MTFRKLPRPVHVCQCGDHAWVNLTRGYVTLVSPEDAHLLELRAWSTWMCKGQPRYAGCGDGLLHVIISGSVALTDHKNRNGFDNRRPNLRSATNSQNVANCARKKNKHGYKGVFKNYKKFGAYIRVNGKPIFLGNHENALAAALAYDKSAIQHFGEFAVLNFSQPPAAAAPLDLPLLGFSPG